MIVKCCPAPSSETMILICGSDAFNKKTITPFLKELGYDMKNVFCY